jgi:dTDP-4-dehydrorhamnose reductase
MKTILVTGGSGLVGSAIKSISEDYDYNFIFISSTDYNLLELDQVKKMF